MNRGGAMRRKSHVTRTCAECGERFTIPASWAARGGGKFCSRACAAAWRRSPEGRAAQARNAQAGRSPSPSNRKGRVGDRAAFDDGRRCRWPGCPTHSVKVDQHHVVYRQEVVRRDGDVWDGRNALALCAPHHATHHHQLTKLPLAALRDENYTYALALMGAAAYDYLRRRYAGEDPRLDALLSAAGRIPASTDGGPHG